MELKDAQKIAEYALPRLLARLPREMRMALIEKNEGEKTMMERLTQQLASSIQWITNDITAKEKERYL